MSDKLKNILIGLFLIAAVSATIYLILFLEPSIGDGKKTIYVRFSNIAGISIGSRVTLAGRPVGEVVAIEVSQNPRNEPADKMDRVYFYTLTLKVDSSVTLYDNDEIAIQTTGLLGEKSIGIIPKAPKKGIIPKPITNETVLGDAIDPLDNALFEFSSLSGKIETTVSDIDKWFVENQENLTASVKNLKDTLNHINVITQDIADGKGTLGKVIKGDDLYLRITTVMSKVDTLMNDINHYGLLFQYDKNWQRIRTKKANLAEAVSQPKEFQHYYENEVDNISTSLSRISILLEKAQAPSQKEKVLNSPQFQQHFARLLHQVEDLLDSLKDYNAKIIENIDNPCSKTPCEAQNK